MLFVVSVSDTPVVVAFATVALDKNVW